MQGYDISHLIVNIMLGAMALFALLFLFWQTILFHRKKKRKAIIDSLDDIVRKPIASGPSKENASNPKMEDREELSRNLNKKISPNVKDAAVLGGGAGALSIFETWKIFGENKGTLKELNDLTYKIPEEAGPYGYLKYFQEEDNIQGVKNLWIGGVAEEKAVAYLNQLDEFKENNWTAHRHLDQTHPGTDIFVTDSADNIVPDVEDQVKSYASVSNFLAAVRNNPDPDYLVNNEIYQQLEDVGLIDNEGILTGLGTKIETFDWSHTKGMHDLDEAVNGMEESSDVADKIPYIAIAFYCWKLAIHAKSVVKKTKTIGEATIDAGRDGTAIIVRGGSAFLVAKSGAAIGTFFSPGIGTVVGGVAGAIIGALVSGHFWKKLFDHLKYKRVRKYYRTIADRVVLEKRREELTELFRAHFADRFTVKKCETFYEKAKNIFLEKTDRKIGKIKEKNWPAYGLDDAIICRNLKEKDGILRLSKAACNAAVSCLAGKDGKLMPLESDKPGQRAKNEKLVLLGLFCYESPAIREKINDFIADLIPKIERERRSLKNDRFYAEQKKLEAGTIVESLKSEEKKLEVFYEEKMSDYILKAVESKKV